MATKKASITITAAKDGGVWVTVEVNDPDPRAAFLNGKKKKRYKVPASTDGAYNQTIAEHAIRGAHASLETEAYRLAGRTKDAPRLVEIDIKTKGDLAPHQKKVAGDLAAGKRPAPHPSVDVEKKTTSARELQEILSDGRPLPAKKPSATQRKPATVDIAAGERPRPTYVDEQGRIQSPVITRTPGGAPVGAGLPTAADMKGLDDDELSAILKRYGITKPWEEMQTDAAVYVKQMSDRLRAGSEEEIHAEVERITGGMSDRRGMLSLARRTQQRTGMADALAASGEADPEFIRIEENDESSCDACIALAGTIGTLSEHEAVGLPGAATCYGGDLCRGQLVLFK
ncbi:MAG: hypothetical protein GY851_07580 [bacterium]|nr:hypothetical protein [bacterium]